MFIFNPITLIITGNPPLTGIITPSFYPMLLQNINLNDGSTVIGGLIVGFILYGGGKLLSWFKNRYDTSLKTSYDIDTLFDNYAEVMKDIDEGNDANRKILEKLDKGSKKMDDLIKENKRTRFVVQELSKLVYDHDEILYNGKKRKKITHIDDDGDEETSKYW